MVGDAYKATSDPEGGRGGLALAPHVPVIGCSIPGRERCGKGDVNASPVLIILQTLKTR